MEVDLMAIDELAEKCGSIPHDVLWPILASAQLYHEDGNASRKLLITFIASRGQLDTESGSLSPDLSLARVLRAIVEAGRDMEYLRWALDSAADAAKPDWYYFRFVGPRAHWRQNPFRGLRTEAHSVIVGPFRSWTAAYDAIAREHG